MSREVVDGSSFSLFVVGPFFYLDVVDLVQGHFLFCFAFFVMFCLGGLGVDGWGLRVFFLDGDVD